MGINLYPQSTLTNKTHTRSDELHCGWCDVTCDVREKIKNPMRYLVYSHACQMCDIWLPGTPNSPRQNPVLVAT